MPKMGSNYRGRWSVAGNTLVEAGVGRTDVKRPIEEARWSGPAGMASIEVGVKADEETQSDSRQATNVVGHAAIPSLSASTLP
uniref:Uncharacterized protein n=2 Tax=Oryza TaxID=4527 RepID=A0A0D3HLQ5_9ORYZ